MNTLREVDDNYRLLTGRELETFRLIGEGLGTVEIANAMKVSVKTVETNRVHIRHKLRITTGTRLVYLAIIFHFTAELRDYP